MCVEAPAPTVRSDGASIPAFDDQSGQTTCWDRRPSVGSWLVNLRFPPTSDSDETIRAVEADEKDMQLQAAQLEADLAAIFEEMVFPGTLEAEEIGPEVLLVVARKAKHALRRSMERSKQYRKRQAKRWRPSLLGVTETCPLARQPSDELDFDKFLMSPCKGRCLGKNAAAVVKYSDECPGVEEAGPVLKSYAGVGGGINDMPPVPAPPRPDHQWHQAPPRPCPPRYPRVRSRPAMLSVTTAVPKSMAVHPQRLSPTGRAGPVLDSGRSRNHLHLSSDKFRNPNSNVEPQIVPGGWAGWSAGPTTANTVDWTKIQSMTGPWLYDSGFAGHSATPTGVCHAHQVTAIPAVKYEIPAVKYEYMTWLHAPPAPPRHSSGGAGLPSRDSLAQYGHIAVMPDGVATPGMAF